MHYLNTVWHESINFTQIQEPPQNSWRQNGDMKHTNIRRQFPICSYLGDRRPATGARDLCGFRRSFLCLSKTPSDMQAFCMPDFPADRNRPWLRRQTRSRNARNAPITFVMSVRLHQSGSTSQCSRNLILGTVTKTVGRGSSVGTATR